MRTQRIPSDWPLPVLAFVLTAFGIAMVYSAGQTDVSTRMENLWRTQASWFVLGLGVAYVISRTSVRLLEWGSVWAYLGACVLLTLLLFAHAELLAQRDHHGIRSQIKRHLNRQGVVQQQPKTAKAAHGEARHRVAKDTSEVIGQMHFPGTWRRCPRTRHRYRFERGRL